MRNVTIFSDSLSSIDAIQSYTPQNAIVSQIRFIIHTLKQQKTSITFCWIPSHIGIEGNERVDIYAKDAISLRPSISILPIEDYLSYTKQLVKEK